MVTRERCNIPFCWSRSVKKPKKQTCEWILESTDEAVGWMSAGYVISGASGVNTVVFTVIGDTVYGPHTRWQWICASLMIIVMWHRKWERARGGVIIKGLYLSLFKNNSVTDKAEFEGNGTFSARCQTRTRCVYCCLITASAERLPALTINLRCGWKTPAGWCRHGRACWWGSRCRFQEGWDQIGRLSSAQTWNQRLFKHEFYSHGALFSLTLDIK